MKAKPIEPGLVERLDYNPETGVLLWKASDRWNREGEEAGYIRSNGYRYVKIDGQHYMSHRLIWVIQTGQEPRSQIDHINGIRSDNRWVNLRKANQVKNSQNQRLAKNSTSGIYGVNFNKRAQKWTAKINHAGKTVFLGASESLLEASCLRKSAEIEYGYHPNHGKPRIEKQLKQEREKKHA